MDLEALSRIFGDPTPKPPTNAPEPAAASTDHTAAHPQASAPPSNKSASQHVIKKARQHANIEAREERAAIMEYDGGLSRVEAEAAAARLHPDPIAEPATPTASTQQQPSPVANPPASTAIDPAGPWFGYTRADLAAIEPDLWPEIEHQPETLQAFARALSENPEAPQPGATSRHKTKHHRAPTP
ncbi:hypothetical protein [Halochromatium roseum]|uniref:hypothetical protein n=1 Tax=Halochromatium roseum TaxID=391920 RepID=UPI0019133BE4|nr:hypothetical protein [Halochromatium roseum]MBK5937697.1 hypothetical protein [Halochromatium roseum]